VLQQLVKSGPIWKMPTYFTPLIGREQDVATICALLQQPEVRLLTLLGIGGIGKTRLSIQAATNLRSYFTEGACFVPLSIVSDPEQVIPTIAQELGILETKEQPIFEHVKVSLQDRHFLLLLDNFEQVVAAAPDIEELLAACPGLKVMVTSRVVLQLQAEQQFPVLSLSLPSLNPLPDLKSLAEYTAVSLFVQRARTILPNFQLTEANAQAIAEICVHLDGLPLAIELAAARIKLLSPAAILTRLSQRFELLTGEARRHPPRHQTLRNTLKWSYDLLESEEQQFFRQLSVFVESFSLEGAEAVRSADNKKGSALSTLDGITSLLDKSLLLRHEQEGEEPRFRMLETVREYGLECLRELAELEQIQRLHAMYYLSLVEQAEPQLKGRQQIKWLTFLEQELENLRAALGWLIEHGEAEHTLQFCGALWRFWYLRGYWSEGRRWLALALQMKPLTDQTALRAKALYGAGELACYQNDGAATRPLLEESIAIYRTLGIKKELANALGALGIALHPLGDPSGVSVLLEESEALCRTLDNKWELAHLLCKLASLALFQEDVAQAATRAQEALLLAQELGDKDLTATVLSTLAHIAAFQGDLKEIIALNRERLTLAQELGNKYLIAIALQNISYYSALQGDLTQVESAYQGLKLARELGTKRLIIVVLHTVGYVTERQGNMNEAAIWYRQGFDLAHEIGDETEMGWHLTGLASVAAAAGQFYRAAHLFGAAAKRLDVTANMNSIERNDYEQTINKVRAHLGEEVFASAWAVGQTMTPEQALTVPEPPPALQSPVPLEPPTTPTEPQPTKTSRSTHAIKFTAREKDVLRELAQGLTDVEIAERLVISERTVGKHLENIFQKMGVNTRGAAIRYAIDNGLV
jgi:predicted ATPase/DNA-binding CsgD family transcriptional regulator